MAIENLAVDTLVPAGWPSPARYVDIDGAGNRWFRNPFPNSAGFAVMISEGAAALPTTLEVLAAVATADAGETTNPSAAQIVDLGDVVTGGALVQGQFSVATPAPIIGLRAAGGSPDLRVWIVPFKPDLR